VREDATLTEEPTFHALVERLYTDQGLKLWRSVAAFTGSRQVADEAVAEAFAQLLRRGDGVRNPTGWVWTAAFRIAAGELQHREKTQLQSMPRDYEMPEPVFELMRALARLPRLQRAVIVLHDYADRPTDEIAKTLGIARSTVRVHISRGRRTLRTMLEESHE